MINILGESKGNIIKGAEKLKNETYLHLYDKGEAKNKRKMGHITILGENALEKAIKARNEIYWSES
jgi:5-(carboxyamino)imidazole ribonucleotide synthase